MDGDECNILFQKGGFSYGGMVFGIGHGTVTSETTQSFAGGLRAL